MVAAVDKEEIWDTLDKADRLRVKREMDKEAILDRKCAVDRLDTGVEVGKGKVHTAVAVDIWVEVEVVEEVAGRMTHTWTVWIPWAAMGVAVEQRSWNISEALVVLEAEDTSDSIFSLEDIPWALRRMWSKGVDWVSEAQDTPSSLDVDDTLRQTKREVSVVVLSVESVSCSRELTWRSSPTMASSSVICSLRRSRFERTSLALATNTSSTLSTNRRCSWTRC